MITFVTAFVTFHEDRSKDKSESIYVDMFKKAYESGANFHIFVSEDLRHLAAQFERATVEVLSLEETRTWSDIATIQHRLPASRTEYHDTERFLALMNAKTELVARAAKRGHYAWFDFGIFHVIRRHDEAVERLRMMSQSTLRDGFWIPGCWDRGMPSFDSVHWRFCGGFFIGDRNAVLDFDKRMSESFPRYLQEGILTWEVNVWARLEAEGWSPTWYGANHDDSILRIPPNAFMTVASLTTIPPRETECRAAIDSLLHQVDHIYLAISTSYRRFGPYTPPPYLREEPYASKVTACISEDFGPASKYIGTTTPHNTWVFVCDDDQEYAPNLISRMKSSLRAIGVYQNHYHSIKEKTSGGMVHGYVGNLIHSSILEGLRSFPLPECARFVDDQWVSMYCQLNNIPVFPTEVEQYHEIFKVTENGHEKLGTESLSGLNTRADKVCELETYFGVSFLDKRA